jgi:hypothetical protein
MLSTVAKTLEAVVPSRPDHPVLVPTPHVDSDDGRGVLRRPKAATEVAGACQVTHW